MLAWLVIIRQSWPPSQHKGYMIFLQDPNHIISYDKAKTIKEACDVFNCPKD